jgi:hypothetical protein
MVRESLTLSDHLESCKRVCYASFAKVTRFSSSIASSSAFGSATHATAVNVLAAVLSGLTASVDLQANSEFSLSLRFTHPSSSFQPRFFHFSFVT